jgi:hypothetical protein
MELVQKRAQEEAAERALEKKHGGKEALAKWRAENADRLRAEKAAADAKARQEAADKVVIDQFVTLQSELGTFGPLDLKSARLDLSTLTVNKAMVRPIREPLLAPAASRNPLALSPHPSA